MRVPWIDVDSAFVEMDTWSRQLEALLGTRLESRQSNRAFETDPGLVEGRDGAMRWVADLPGVKREDLDVKVENGTLILDVKRDTTPPAGWTLRHAERSPFELRRTVRLPDGLDVDAITATFDHGVLTVSLPRRPHQTRTIEIRHS